MMEYLIYHLGGARRPIRATRYSRELPSLYRVVGAKHWQRGLTINISESGVLLQPASPLALHTRLEMTFQLSEAIGRFQVGQVACIGEVVRRAPPTESTSPFPVAARWVVFVGHSLDSSSGLCSAPDQTWWPWVPKQPAT